MQRYQLQCMVQLNALVICALGAIEMPGLGYTNNNHKPAGRSIGPANREFARRAKEQLKNETKSIAQLAKPVPIKRKAIEMNQWLWSVIHNCLVHPLMPFLPFQFIDVWHDWTARKAFGD